jgi:hypothetical protein
MRTRTMDSIMAWFRFQPFAAAGVGVRDGEEDEDYEEAEGVGHGVLRFGAVARGGVLPGLAKYRGPSLRSG